MTEYKFPKSIKIGFDAKMLADRLQNCDGDDDALAVYKLNDVEGCFFLGNCFSDIEKIKHT